LPSALTALHGQHPGRLSDIRLAKAKSRHLGQPPRGAVTNQANPKSVTFVVALLPQFVDRGLGHVPLQFAVLGAIFVAFEVLVDGPVGLSSGPIGGRLSRRRRARQARDVSRHVAAVEGHESPAR
jgi:threonine/homoserine/homoserine lactone efflux protein